MNFLEIESSTITKLDSLSTKVENVKNTENDLQECRQKLYKIEVLKQQKQEALTQKVCPTCGQSVNTNCPELVIPDNTKLKEQEIFLQSKLTILQSEIGDLLSKRHQNDMLTQKLGYMRELLSTMERHIQEIENSANPYQPKIDILFEQQKDRVKEINKTKVLIAECTLLVQHLEFLQAGFKEIKSYVFQSLLIQLNTKTNKYLAELFEISASIQFTNISDEGEISKITTTVLLDGIERSLGLLSGGQFRRVQLAVDFALSEIIAERANKPISDESFKDLSSTSMEKIVNILQKMPGGTILIEHNEIVKSIINRTFEIEYKNGISTHS
jgi:energy-coupling factor transporter ATP-binding protein EcfA2